MRIFKTKPSSKVSPGERNYVRGRVFSMSFVTDAVKAIPAKNSSHHSPLQKLMDNLHFDILVIEFEKHAIWNVCTLLPKKLYLPKRVNLIIEAYNIHSASAKFLWGCKRFATISHDLLAIIERNSPFQVEVIQFGYLNSIFKK